MSEPRDLARPSSGDVVDLILEDHRWFENLLRELRDDTSDRDDVRRTLGTSFAEERNKQIEADCGRVENVRQIVTRARRAGLLDHE